MKDRLIMEIMISLDREHIVTLEGEGQMVKMIPFTGTVKSEIFTGIVEPCGVDTQVTNWNGVRHMSARYMLTGTDADGQSCHIYIENNGWFTNGEKPRPFRTIPTFITDSKALAPYLHRAVFRGEGAEKETCLVISFYEILP